MFFFLAICATLGYGLQVALMARFYRTVDPITVTAFRGLSLAISMSPLLLFVSPSEIIGIVNFWHVILGAAVTAAIANSCAAASVRYLPVGVSNALQNGTAVIFVTLIGYLVFAETLSVLEIGFIAALIAGNLFLGLDRDQIEAFADKNSRLGFLFASLFGLFIAISFVMMTHVARELNPLVSGYFWESMIGVVALIATVARALKSGESLSFVSKEEFRGILIAASPTVVGTACVSLAVTMGPVALASAITSAMMVVSAIVCYFIYGERLHAKQWLSILFLITAIFGLKLSGG